MLHADTAVIFCDIRPIGFVTIRMIVSVEMTCGRFSSGKLIVEIKQNDSFGEVFEKYVLPKTKFKEQSTEIELSFVKISADGTNWTEVEDQLV